MDKNINAIYIKIISEFCLYVRNKNDSCRPHLLRFICVVMVLLVSVSCQTLNSKSAKDEVINDKENIVKQDNVKVEFISYANNKPPYLAMNLNFKRYDQIRKNIEKKNGYTLKNRGEAHITVISPPEYQKISQFIEMKEIDLIAIKNKIQDSKIEEVCVGRGKIRDSNLETYFVVVNSENLIRIREVIYQEIIKKGASVSDFDPNLFYPHITLGFNERDLHFQDGVIKDNKSCLINL